ncbi:MAG: phage portal protein family protein [Kiritimatiellia bacterium]
MKSLKSMIAARLAKFLSGASVPTKQITITTSLQEPPTLAPTMDAGQLMSIIGAAEGGYTRDLFALYRDVLGADSHLQTELAKRKLKVLGDALAFLPGDKLLQADVDTATRIKDEVENCGSWFNAMSHLLDSTLWPVSLVEKVYRATPTGYSLDRLVAVKHHLLDFQSGSLRIFDVDANGQVLTSSHDPDPNRYIVHRGHLLSMPDNYGGPFRSILAWWLLSAMSREWWGRFLERYGSPFMVGKDDTPEGRTILEQAFSWATRVGGLVVSESTTVEIKQAAASDSGDAYSKFLSICQREKSKLVLGGTLSSEAQSTGMNEGVSKLQGDVMEDIRRFDATSLSRTLRDQLIVQLCKINNLPGRPPKLVWGSESKADMDSLTGTLKNLPNAGLEPTDEALPLLSERYGFGIQRKAGGAPAPFATMNAPGVRAFTAEGQDDPIAREASAPLAQAFRGALAPVRKIILESRSAQECEARIRAFYTDWNPARTAALVGEALTAYAVNGVSAVPGGKEGRSV